MAAHRTRVGVHGRNAVRFTEADYELVRRAHIETLKMMSITDVSVFQRLRREHPTLEFIVRLYDDRLHQGNRPGPDAFVERMVPIIQRLKPFVVKFEIHNEPNHASGVEAWGASDDHARSFSFWYVKVLAALKRACPWARFGFPGLALNHPHRDLEWLALCRDAINASDWLACHCYWQYGNMMSEQWGLRFKLYRKAFPAKQLEITEFGNSTPGLPADEMARQYTQYYQALNRYPYLGSASAFIASSPDPAWAPFAWMREGGDMLPIVNAVGTMERKAVNVVTTRTSAKTGKKVQGSFLDFFDRYGQEMCGDPITNQFKEAGKLVQWFERLVMEEVSPGKISLRAVGSEALGSRAEIAELKALVDKLSVQPVPTAEVIVDKLSSLVAALAEQINALQAELAKAEAKTPSSGPQPLLDSLRQQIATLQKVSTDLHAELAAALKAMSEDQSALIDYWRGKEQGQPGQPEEPAAPAEPPPAPPAPAPAPLPGGVTQPAIQNIVDQLTRHATLRYRQRSLSDIQTLVIHHSASPSNTTPQQIARYHVAEWHWPGIGYHFVVSADGLIWQTNALETVSNHVANANTACVGICFVGQFDQTAPPAPQIQAGARLVAWLLQHLHLELEAAKGHQELMSTDCPGAQWRQGPQWKGMLLQAIAQLQQGS